MSHLHLIPGDDDAAERPAACAPPEIAERMHAARDDGSIEAALHIWGARVRAARDYDVAWRTTRPSWHGPGRLDNWLSPVWLPTAREARRKPVAPLRLASLFDQAA